MSKSSEVGCKCKEKKVQKRKKIGCAFYKTKFIDLRLFSVFSYFLKVKCSFTCAIIVIKNGKFYMLFICSCVVLLFFA